MKPSISHVTLYYGIKAFIKTLDSVFVDSHSSSVSDSMSSTYASFPLWSTLRVDFHGVVNLYCSEFCNSVLSSSFFFFIFFILRTLWSYSIVVFISFEIWSIVHTCSMATSFPKISSLSMSTSAIDNASSPYFLHIIIIILDYCWYLNHWPETTTCHGAALCLLLSW